MKNDGDNSHAVNVCNSTQTKSSRLHQTETSDLDHGQSSQNVLTPPCGVTVVVHVDKLGQNLEIYSKRQHLPTTSVNNSSSVIDPQLPKRLQISGNHFPECFPPGENGKRNPSRRCVVCSFTHSNSKRRPNGRLLRHETRYRCEECQVALCIAPRLCFRHYHTKKNYFVEDT